jgi:glutaminase
MTAAPAGQLPLLLERIDRQARERFGLGRVADYIPALADVDPRQFGLAVALVDGTCHAIGQADVPFSLQSITKLFTFVLAFRSEGDGLWRRVGREPSGAAFNSIVQLETENGIPRNPFINAGALVVTDILTSRYAHLDYALLGALRRLAGEPRCTGMRGWP